MKKWKSKILRKTVRAKIKAGEGCGGIQEEGIEGDEGPVEGAETTDDGREERGNAVEDNGKDPGVLGVWGGGTCNRVEMATRIILSHLTKSSRPSDLFNLSVTDDH